MNEPQPSGTSVTAGRRPGRPSAAKRTQLTKQDIIGLALTKTREIALQDIAITVLARELSVTPQLIHYLMRGRDEITTGVMNAFFRELTESWPRPAGGWRDHMVAMARHLHDHYVKYRGVVLYTATHNRYRIVQAVEEGETDYGIRFLDMLFQGAMLMKLSPRETVQFSEIFIDFVSGQARAAITTRLPRAHQGYLKGIFGKLDTDQFPGIAFAGEDLFQPDQKELFEQGLSMLMDAFEIRRAKLI